MKMKRTLILLLSVLFISAIFISCSAEQSIDLSDIETMNIGTNVPEILYGDDEKIILHGTFGILTYNFKKEKVTQRVDYDAFGEITDSMCGYEASKDGKRIFIVQEQKIYEYNLSSGKCNVVEDIEDERFEQSVIDANMQAQILNSQSDAYLISYTYVEKDNSILFLRAESNWQMKTLQLVEYDMRSNEELKVIDIFK